MYLEQTTAATANDYTQVRAQLRHSYGAATWQAKTMVQVVDTTDIRIFVGVSSTWTPTAADEVFAAAAHNAMFRYSTSASDTNWKFITTDGSSSTVVDTGVAVAAGAWEMYIANLDGGTTYRWAIRAVGGTWTTGTVTTTLPGTGVDQRWQHNGIAVAASAKKTGFHRYTLASLSTVGAPA